MKSQHHPARNENNLLVKGGKEATMKSSRTHQQRPRGRVPKPTQYSSTENSLTSSSLGYENEYGQRTHEQIHSLVKKKTQSTKDTKSKNYTREIFNSSDSELGQEEQKVLIIRNSEFGLKKNDMKNNEQDYAEESIKSKDSLSLDRSSSVSTDDMLCKLDGNQPGRASELRSYSEYLDAYDQNQKKK